MNIYVDADACPVKQSIINIGKQYHFPVIIVHSLSHNMNVDEYAQQIVVDNIPEAADLAIVNGVQAGDVVITQDYGLASLLLPKKVRVINQLGFMYTNENIDSLLMQRHMSAQVRKSGGRVKGPKSFTKQDQQRFERNLRLLLDSVTTE